MLQHPPAEPGMREEDIDTPALVLDLDAFEHNLDTMAALLAPTRTSTTSMRLCTSRATRSPLSKRWVPRSRWARRLVRASSVA